MNKYITSSLLIFFTLFISPKYMLIASIMPLALYKLVKSISISCGVYQYKNIGLQSTFAME